VIACSEALVVHGYAVVKRLWIGDYRPCVPACGQELPHEVVLTDRFGTRTAEIFSSSTEDDGATFWLFA